MLQHPLVLLLQMTFDKYQRDNVPGLAAALAYFAIFSIFPLLLALTSLAGFIVDPERFDVQEQILQLFGSPEVRDLVEQTLEQFTANRVGAGLIGAATLLFAATGIFGALTRSAKEIWETRVVAESGSIKTAVLAMAIEKAIAFGLLFACAALIVVSVLANVALGLVSAYTDWVPFNALLLRLAQIGITVVLLTVVFAVLYKVLPGPVATWGDIWPAAIIAAALFTALQLLAEQIFGRINFSAFGVLGGAMTLLLWIYFCAQIFLVGVELSYAWAHVFGSRREGGPQRGPSGNRS